MNIVQADQSRVYFIMVWIAWFMHSFKPEWVVPGLKFLAPLQTLLLLALLPAWFNYPGKKINNPLTKYFFLFLIAMIVSSILARNNGLCRDTIRGLSILFLSYLGTITFVDTEKRLFSLVTVIILGNILIAVLSLAKGGLVPGVTIFADQNDLALHMNILFPIAVFLGLGETNKTKKIFYYGSSVIFVSALVLSNSRGGAVGLAAVLLFIWVKGRIKKTKVSAFLMVIVLGLILFAPRSYWYEIGTIKQGADESTAAARVFFWKVAALEFVDNPFFGVGVNNFGVWLPDYVDTKVKFDGAHLSGATRMYGRVCHSLYFTLLSELGIAGVLLFSLILHQYFREVRVDEPLGNSIRPWKKACTGVDVAGNPSASTLETSRDLSLGLMGGMIGFLVSGAFLTVLYYPQFWLLCALGVSLANVRKRLMYAAAGHTGKAAPDALMKGA